MVALDCYNRLLKTKVPLADLRFCLVDENKNPYKVDGSRASTSDYGGFVTLQRIGKCPDLKLWAGLGISVQASKVIGIDLDHCVETALDFSTANDKAKDIVNMFKDFAYIEFSFSGKGIRILFRQPMIENYKERYYIKNSKQGIEYYQPVFDGTASNRFLTITGNVIYDNNIDCLESHTDTIRAFLDKYMRRVETERREPLIALNEGKSLDELMKEVRRCYILDQSFQDDWFKEGIHPTIQERDESERDFRLIGFIYEHITQDEEMVKKIFEQSPFFKSKDKTHIRKWEYNNYRYFKYQFSQIAKEYGKGNI